MTPAGYSASRSLTSTRLPADLAIFAPDTWTTPAFSWARANGVTPVNDSAMAVW
jgi:hypothetical protein